MEFARHELPPILAYFVVAVLAVTPQTRPYRVAIWPVVASLAWRRVAALDMSSNDMEQKWSNALAINNMIFILTFTFSWMFPKEPLVRTKGSQSSIKDGIALALTLRGQDWDWSRGVHIPRETRPTDRNAFMCHVFLSAIIHALACSTLHKAVRSFSPIGLSAAGGSIIDDTLPLHARCLRATVIAACAGFVLYAFVQACYDVFTLVGVLVFGQDPAQWPPAFDAPWRATSMSDFWGRRWHQFFRRTFILQGGVPLSYLLGKPGFVPGVFLSSAMMHHLPLFLLNDRSEMWRLLVAFGFMGPVVLAERAFKRYTGRKVDGLAGWIWTMVWLMSLGTLMMDAFARAGLFGRMAFTQRVLSEWTRDAIERSVAGFEAWLRAM